MIKKKSENGDIIMKWWAAIVFALTIVATAAVGYFRIGANEHDLERHEEEQHPLTTEALAEFKALEARNEEKFNSIQRDINRIQTEQRAGFAELREAIKELDK